MSCPSAVDWDPVAAAVSSSAIAAVLAGFVFSGIVVVLSTKAREKQNAPAARALKLFLMAFVGLAVTAYMFSDLAGEKVCPRANTEEVLTGGMLATFAVIMLTALTWLITAYGPETTGVLDFLRRLVCLASGLVVLLLAVSSQGTLSSSLPYRAPFAGNVAIYVLAALAIAVLAGDALDWRIPWLPTRIRTGLTAMTAGPPAKDDERVRWVARSASAYLGVNALATGVALALYRSFWQSARAAWFIYGASWWALVVPLAVLGFAMRALARPADASGSAITTAVEWKTVATTSVADAGGSVDSASPDAVLP
jgi:hypothetical protein